MERRGEKGNQEREKKEREEKERRKKMRKEKNFTTPGFEPATFNSTGTHHISIADFHFDDLIVAALAHVRSLCQLYSIPTMVCSNDTLGNTSFNCTI